MRFHFKYIAKPSDFWRLFLYNTYTSMIGVCNIIFTVSLTILTVSIWTKAEGILRLFLLAGCLLFPVLQPLLLYRKAWLQASSIPSDMEMDFDESGLHIMSGGQKNDIHWKTIRQISKKAGMIVIFPQANGAFFLTNEMLGKEKEDLYRYALQKMNC